MSWVTFGGGGGKGGGLGNEEEEDTGAGSPFVDWKRRRRTRELGHLWSRR